MWHMRIITIDIKIKEPLLGKLGAFWLVKFDNKNNYLVQYYNIGKFAITELCLVFY